MSPSQGPTAVAPKGDRLSYKFQRLREQLRQAILSGEFGDRLPGERELGRRFSANAKTINKALCDLANEGLIVRHIGRGTFVAGRCDETSSRAIRSRTLHWLCSSENGDVTHESTRRCLEKTLAQLGHRLVVRTPRFTAEGRVDFDRAFFRTSEPVDAVVLCALRALSEPGQGQPTEALILALARRQIATVVVGAACSSVKRHAVIPDYPEAGFRLCEFAAAAGCREVVIARKAMESPEAQAVMVGLEASCRRWSLTVRNIVFGGEASDAERGGGDSPGCANGQSATICLGGDAMERVVDGAGATGAVLAVMEPGDDRASRLGVTSYEFELPRFGEWAVRLATETRPGDTPMHVHLPGRIIVRTNAGASKGDTIPTAEAVV